MLGVSFDIIRYVKSSKSFALVRLRQNEVQENFLDRSVMNDNQLTFFVATKKSNVLHSI
jgi:hypothetical protein